MPARARSRSAHDERQIQARRLVAEHHRLIDRTVSAVINQERQRASAIPLGVLQVMDVGRQYGHARVSEGLLPSGVRADEAQVISSIPRLAVVVDKLPASGIYRRSHRLAGGQIRARELELVALSRAVGRQPQRHGLIATGLIDDLAAVRSDHEMVLRGRVERDVVCAGGVVRPELHQRGGLGLGERLPVQQDAVGLAEWQRVDRLQRAQPAVNRVVSRAWNLVDELGTRVAEPMPLTIRD